MEKRKSVSMDAFMGKYADAACVILAEGAMLDEAAVKKAALQGITVLRTEEPVFETALAVKELLK